MTGVRIVITLQHAELEEKILFLIGFILILLSLINDCMPIEEKYIFSIQYAFLVS